MEPSDTPAAAAAAAAAETLEQMQARHRREQRDLQGRVTNKKKSATKKTRKGVGDECAELERRLRERQAEELRRLGGGQEEEGEEGEGDEEEKNGEDDGAEQRQGQVTAGVNGLSLGDTTAAQRQQASPTATTTAGAAAGAGGGGGGAGGKKRNRQKERLARRAAEQEAAAAAAEEEAAGMVDHRGRESAYMRREMAAHGLVEKDIRPDGHCLFSAVADQLLGGGEDVGGAGGDEVEPYRAVRRAAAGYMLEHADDFAPFLEEPLGTYAARIRDTAEWGGQLELAALASRYGVEIRVLQDGRTEVIEPAAGDGGAAAGGGAGGKRKTVWLAYYRHGYGLGEHYNSLRKAPPA
ncbi:uncharacterized protein E0L32_000105 [Thyridium curvatum]|uniref:OTU domain-containing protein n=1 Tax=Thyridium curvatum TaxID=1093900 RepID=A0A507BFM5_9PEZI|nr:uncharacterized protein E0L32_000105 [Thyridium curvatum]TPX15771.1 hypothetical protein E0L32_000105 [Thyridium curvatum]